MRLSLADVRRIKFDPTMGLQAFHAIAPGRIVAKALVPPALDTLPPSDVSAVVTRLRQWAFMQRLAAMTDG